MLMRFHTTDPLYPDFPGVSPWAHTAANPLNAVDPDGEYVIADEWCQQGILDGLGEDEIKFVQFNKNGELDLDLLQQCSSMSACYTALRTLAESNVTYIFKGATEVQVGENLRSMVFTEGEEDNVLHGRTIFPGIQKSPLDYTGHFAGHEPPLGCL